MDLMVEKCVRGCKRKLNKTHSWYAEFWVVVDGSETNEFRKMSMKMCDEKKRLWGQAKYKVSSERVKIFSSTFICQNQFFSSNLVKVI